MNLRLARVAFMVSIFALFASFASPSLINIHAQEAARSAATISGRVVAEDGRPIAGATINIRPVAAPDAGGNRTTGTNDDGHFVVTDLDAGAYTLNASAPGYVPSPDPNNPNREPRFFRRGDSNITLTLAKGSVITGRVTDGTGAPVVGVSVRAIMTRDAENRIPRQPYSRERATDDRGIYRIFGIEPGTYLIAAGRGNTNSYPRVAAYDGDAPTYHPSATSDTALPVVVRGGMEASGIDITYRGTRGHTVSGKLIGAATGEGNTAVTVSLVNTATNITESTAFVDARNTERGYSFDGVSDGTYRIVARRYARDDTDEGLTSPPRRIVVKGADITGLELPLAPLVSLAGQIRILAPDTASPDTEACRLQIPSSETPMTEAVIRLRRNERPTTETDAPRNDNFAPNTVPDEHGTFRLRNIEAGAHRFDIRLSDSTLYVQNITLNRPSPKSSTIKRLTSKSAPAAKPATGDAIAEFVLANGERPPSAIITLARGAARIAGNIERATTSSAASPRTDFRVHLIPAAPEHLDHAWRYYETIVAANGTWTLANIAPGTYRLIALAADAETNDAALRPRAADTESRLTLRRQAEANGTRIELAPCSRLDEYALRAGDATTPR
ncbi:MAG: carboxypeptidase-like regulatory domain-containing protein [Pyrinomonadaceae bacterium MAG19_C2-C3]|nr:carboxypeptidase-like regulatory domain-containing protein [Pyrinomonadaceae bacterium MAG19_C2-C3]